MATEGLTSESFTSLKPGRACNTGVKGSVLSAKIPNAQTMRILGGEEVAQAQGARLVGRGALHRMATVSQTQAMIALGATVDLLNHIGGWKPASP